VNNVRLFGVSKLGRVMAAGTLASAIGSLGGTMLVGEYKSTCFICRKNLIDQGKT
jgi:hypothetical protein